jgi:hypothetical protein
MKLIKLNIASSEVVKEGESNGKKWAIYSLSLAQELPTLYKGYKVQMFGKPEEGEGEYIIKKITDKYKQLTVEKASRAKAEDVQSKDIELKALFIECTMLMERKSKEAVAAYQNYASEIKSVIEKMDYIDKKTFLLQLRIVLMNVTDYVSLKDQFFRTTFKGVIEHFNGLNI